MCSCVCAQAAQLAPVLGSAAHVMSAPVEAGASPAQHLRAYPSPPDQSQLGAGAPAHLTVANTSYKERAAPCAVAHLHGKPAEVLPSQIGNAVATFISFDSPGARLLLDPGSHVTCLSFCEEVLMHCASATPAQLLRVALSGCSWLPSTEHNASVIQCLVCGSSDSSVVLERTCTAKSTL
jgi:hypothetical protein